MLVTCKLTLMASTFSLKAVLNSLVTSVINLSSSILFMEVGEEVEGEEKRYGNNKKYIRLSCNFFRLSRKYKRNLNYSLQLVVFGDAAPKFEKGAAEF